MSLVSTMNWRDALKQCATTTDIDEIIELTKHDHPQVRQRALREMCPCRVKNDIDDFWIRVLEMLDDPAKNVRQQVSFIQVFQVNVTPYWLKWQ